MTGAKHISSVDQDTRSLHCLKLPMRSMAVLIPMISVAEIDAVQMQAVKVGKNPWSYGTYHWHNVAIPLIDLDVLCHGCKPLESYRYIAVLHTQQKDTLHPFYALVMQNIPGVTRIEYQDLALEDEELPPLIFQVVTVDEKKHSIPDLIGIEKEIASL